MGFAITLIMFHFGYGNLTPMGSIGIADPYLMVFLNGLLAAGGVWVIHQLVEALERTN